MSREPATPLMILQLVISLLFSSGTIAYACFTLWRIKIKLNRITRVKWALALAAILMRTSLSIVEFHRRDYHVTAFKYYFLFVID